MTATKKKKAHHYVHDDYIDAWRQPEGRIYALNRWTGKPFDPTGRNSVGAENGFNNFSFDSTVLALLNYSFRDKANRGGGNNAYRTMLAFLDFMKDYDYENKESDFLEDLYGQFEGKIAFALKAVRENHPPPHGFENETFDSLVMFYCIQMMRTSKSRKLMLAHFAQLDHGPTELTRRQAIEFCTVHLLINSLAMAADISARGCRLSFSFTRQSETFINSDAPVILLDTDHLSRIEQHTGRLPLSPTLVMELDSIGCAGRAQRTREVSTLTVDTMNHEMAGNADRSLYFTTRAQRDRFASVGMNSLHSPST